MQSEKKQEQGNLTIRLVYECGPLYTCRLYLRQSIQKYVQVENCEARMWKWGKVNQRCSEGGGLMNEGMQHRQGTSQKGKKIV